MSRNRYPILFVTGTDTEVGKTVISCALLQAFQQHHVIADGFKPLASGAKWIDGQLRNEDGLALQAYSARRLDYTVVNPNTFEPAIAPHIASRIAHQSVDIRLLDGQLEDLVQGSEQVIIEGAGGWQVPLNDRQRFADWVGGHHWPVILVVGIRLGCINHALLSAESIRQMGCTLVGWIANHCQPSTPVLDENVSYLQVHLKAPKLGSIGYRTRVDVADIAHDLDISVLLKDD
ncbi:dethiobiotin synthase [Celerinatantimonas yamalensis]|uniref:ATP-dependent dethiobiotin synthetase BioD n=1 Tax=Celerinatantimonas yamalensis TaxID=559956 RepID=A0ABW9G6N3_9GAMM